jgi:steroid delta-isomerase
MPNPTCAETVAEYFAAIRAMDADRWVAAFAPDAVSHDPVGAPPHEGHAALHAFLSGIGSMFTSLSLTENNVFINGNSAAVKWTGKGVGKNGAHVTFEGVDVIDCNADGKIVLVRAFWDPAPVLAAIQA